MDDVVLVQESYSTRQLAHKAPVGLGVGSAGQDVLVEVPALAKLHDEPEVARLLWVTQDALPCRVQIKDGQI